MKQVRTRTVCLAIVFLFGLGEPLMAEERIVISSAWGEVRAELADNEAARSLLRMLPITIQMRDHLRQEKTGNLPAPLAETSRQTSFSKGTLGLWTSDHFVIYYREAGRSNLVPRSSENISLRYIAFHSAKIPCARDLITSQRSDVCPSVRMPDRGWKTLAVAHEMPTDARFASITPS
jgi:hypothetical protein